MKRLALILAAYWLAAAPAAKAGELDAEFNSKAKVSTPAPALERQASSELDAESPDQACRCGWRRRYYGFGGYGYGYPGFGFGFAYGRGYYGYGRGFYGRGRW